MVQRLLWSYTTSGELSDLYGEGWKGREVRVSERMGGGHVHWPIRLQCSSYSLLIPLRTFFDNQRQRFRTTSPAVLDEDCESSSRCGFCWQKVSLPISC
jgi:hypothetical protein